MMTPEDYDREYSAMIAWSRFENEHRHYWKLDPARMLFVCACGASRDERSVRSGARWEKF